MNTGIVNLEEAQLLAKGLEILPDDYKNRETVFKIYRNYSATWLAYHPALVTLVFNDYSDGWKEYPPV